MELQFIVALQILDRIKLTLDLMQCLSESQTLPDLGTG